MLSVRYFTGLCMGRTEGGRDRRETATSRARVQNLQELRRLERQLAPDDGTSSQWTKRDWKAYSYNILHRWLPSGVAQKSP